MGWIELFGLEEEEPIFQKRILSVVSGAVLPLVALGFIKSLTDYIRPEESEELTIDTEIKKSSDNVTEVINDQPVKTSEKVIDDSSKEKENNEDSVLPRIDNAVIDSSRLSKTDVHYVEIVPKTNDESIVTKPGQTERKHYNPKP